MVLDIWDKNWGTLLPKLPISIIWMRFLSTYNLGKVRESVLNVVYSSKELAFLYDTNWTNWKRGRGKPIQVFKRWISDTILLFIKVFTNVIDFILINCVLLVVILIIQYKSLWSANRNFHLYDSVTNKIEVWKILVM